jgi:hypothetical protein
MEITTKTIPHLRLTCRNAFSAARQSALEAKALIEAVSADIEHYTARVCRDCASVCCINRHSRHDRSDIIFLTALGMDVPEDLSKTEETAPCRFLGSNGCVLERVQRPYRCTWFFCTPLLDHIAETPGPGGYRKFLTGLQKITEKRTLMLHNFEMAAAGILWHEEPGAIK